MVTQKFQNDFLNFNGQGFTESQLLLMRSTQRLLMRSTQRLLMRHLAFKL